MSSDEEDSYHCYFSRQPENESELYKAIQAVWASDVQCLRYAGEDRDILRRLAEIDSREACDHADLVLDVSAIVRNHVTFAAGHISQAYELANAFYEYLIDDNQGNKDLRLSKIRKSWGAITFSYSWYRDVKPYSFWFEKFENRWHIYHAKNVLTVASRSMSVGIENWLQRDNRFSDLKWFTESEWRTGRSIWSPTAI